MREESSCPFVARGYAAVPDPSRTNRQRGFHRRFVQDGAGARAGGLPGDHHGDAVTEGVAQPLDDRVPGPAQDPEIGRQDDGDEQDKSGERKPESAAVARKHCGEDNVEEGVVLSDFFGEGGVME